MENVARFEEKYEAFQKNKKIAARKCVRSLVLWGILLVPAIWLGVFLYEWVDSASSMLGMIIVSIPLLIIMGVMLLWPFESWRAYRGCANRMTYEMSLDMMENSLQERFGFFTRVQVMYPIFQSLCGNDANVEYNNRLAWLEGDAPFMIHRASIHNGEYGEDSRVYFDGTAISVAADDPFWRYEDRPSMEYKLEKVWKHTFRDEIAERPLFGLDEIGDRLWLTVGFYGLKLGEKDMEVWDLERWYQQCQKEVDLLNRALELIRSITPASCGVVQKAGRQ